MGIYTLEEISEIVMQIVIEFSYKYVGLVGIAVRVLACCSNFVGVDSNGSHLNINLWVC